jgi:hypothetical protein
LIMPDSARACCVSPSANQLSYDAVQQLTQYSSANQVFQAKRRRRLRLAVDLWPGERPEKAAKPLKRA